MLISNFLLHNPFITTNTKRTFQTQSEVDEMNSKNRKVSCDETPIKVPLAAMLSTENLGGGVEMNTDNLGAGLTEYIGWRMVEEDSKN